jgi:hypothetical protein
LRAGRLGREKAQRAKIRRRVETRRAAARNHEADRKKDSAPERCARGREKPTAARTRNQISDGVNRKILRQKIRERESNPAGSVWIETQVRKPSWGKDTAGRKTKRECDQTANEQMKTNSGNGGQNSVPKRTNLTGSK